MRDGGKGDAQRPLVVPMEQFDNNWDAIFKQKPEAPSIEDQFMEEYKKWKESEINK
jgi:hypothetical protein